MKIINEGRKINMAKEITKKELKRKSSRKCLMKETPTKYIKKKCAEEREMTKHLLTT